MVKIVHIVKYQGWSKLCVDIILAILYISLCNHPICTFKNERMALFIILYNAVKYEPRRAYPFNMVTL